MDMTNRLKERFCKDMKLPIKMYDDDVFYERLYLCAPFYNVGGKDAEELYRQFRNSLKKYKTEQDYFEDYNRIKDEAINFIKETEAYKRFNSMDMNDYSFDKVLKDNFTPDEYQKLIHCSKDIFHPSNAGRCFISFDICKANFNCLHNFDANMFGNVDTWEGFIAGFTDNPHIINSKYIREVILGNCNPKRHITYEKYICANALVEIVNKLKEKGVSEYNIVFFSNDEIIFDITDYENEEYKKLYDIDNEACSIFANVPMKIEVFGLYKLLMNDEIIGYVKGNPRKVSIKSADAAMMPFIMRTLNEEDYTEKDFVSDVRWQENEDSRQEIIEVKDMETNELRLILQDQQDLYTPQELKIIKDEYDARTQVLWDDE